jgi:hypothetical protein
MPKLDEVPYEYQHEKCSDEHGTVHWVWKNASPGPNPVLECEIGVSSIFFLYDLVPSKERVTCIMCLSKRSR